MNSFLLVGVTWQSISLGILYVSLALLVIIIAYRQLLKYLGKGGPVKEKYMVLYSVERDDDSGEYNFYFTSEEPKEYEFMLLNEEMKLVSVIASGTSSAGGNIVRMSPDKKTEEIAFYCLQTGNQKTMKRF